MRGSAAAAALAVLASVAVVGCGRPDYELVAAVETRLALDLLTADAAIEVSASDGVVRLAGEAANRVQLDRARTRARQVEGVRAVVDELRLADSAIQMAVESALAADPMVAGVALDVTVREGVVILASDNTDQNQRDRAIAISSRVDGVAEVRDFMR